MKKALLILLISLLFISCVHKSPFKDEYYFQAMGESSEIVITTDMEKLSETSLNVLPEDDTTKMLTERADRLSVGLMPKTTEIYPLPIEEYTVYGGIEGNLGKISVNTALSWAEDFHKENEDGVTYYTNGTLQASVPKSGILIFSNESYVDAYNKTFKNREKLISDEIASEMAASAASVYLNTPQTLIDIGFELPDTALKQIERCYFMIDEVDGKLYMNGKMFMWDEGGAKTMNTILRNQLLVTLRKEAKETGAKVDIKALAGYFNYEDNLVTISSFELKGDMADKAQGIINDAIGGML